MRNGLKLILAIGCGAAMLQLTTAADNKPAPPEQKKAPADPKEQKEMVSYGVGMTFGNQIKRASFEVDVDVVAKAIKDVLAGGELKYTEAQVREAIMAYQKEINGKKEEEQKLAAEKHKKEGETFLAENKQKPGVKTHAVTMPDGSSAELQYKVLKDGTGEMPKTTDTVSVNYRGTFIDGKEFDSSAKHGGQPAKFPVTGVVRGWTEALQMMKVGSKWELYLPSSLAYGDRGNPRGNPPIDPGAALIFEMELVGTETPPAPPTPQPLTSDIIKVPSAEELKKGAKIEVIKPEEAARLAAQAQTNGAKIDKN